MVNYPTGFILKPQVDEFEALPEAEQLVMCMADIVGIVTVPHALIQNNGSYAYITKRIDRKISKDNVQLIAMEDFCQLDLRLTQDKYKGSYERCAKIVDKYSSRQGLDMTELYLRIVFSYVVGNSDMHLKNFSLIETEEGSGEYILSPAYDLLPVNLIMPEDKEQFALTMNGKKQNIRRKDFLIYAEKCGISKVSAEKMIESIVKKKDKFINMCMESLLPEHLKNVKNKKEINVLDIGTGPGFFSILLAERGYNVSAVDYTEEMLVKAKDNAGIFKDEIDFRRMDAQNLNFDNNQFDLIVTRNLTWVLEDPEKAYKEWFRVLKPGGKLLNFDANWYCHLSDETKKREFALTRENLKREGIYDYFVDGEGIDNDWMDDIARQMPLTYIVRPTWDICKLKDIGFREATAETEKVFEVLTPEEKENYKNSPMFMIEAVK